MQPLIHAACDLHGTGRRGATLGRGHIRSNSDSAWARQRSPRHLQCSVVDWQRPQSMGREQATTATAGSCRCAGPSTRADLTGCAEAAAAESAQSSSTPQSSSDRTGSVTVAVPSSAGLVAPRMLRIDPCDSHRGTTRPRTCSSAQLPLDHACGSAQKPQPATTVPRTWLRAVDTRVEADTRPGEWTTAGIVPGRGCQSRMSASRSPLQSRRGYTNSVEPQLISGRRRCCLLRVWHRRCVPGSRLPDLADQTRAVARGDRSKTTQRAGTRRRRWKRQRRRMKAVGESLPLLD